MSHIKQNPLRIIGACAPSSKGLAMAMARFVSSEKKQHILEVGAGTGAITQQIIRNMGPHHRLDVVEIFPILANMLQRRFSGIPGVKIHARDIMKFEPSYKYDLIISSLPFNSMVPEVVEVIIQRILRLAKGDAIMSFYEYRIIQNLVRPFMGKSFFETRKLIEALVGRYQFEELTVKLNIPPAMVHYLKLGDKKRQRS